jgi:hypothetical protein
VKLTTSLYLILLVFCFSVVANAAPTAAQAVSLTENPLIMRLGKDEFRIAFGINAEQYAPNGCHGSIRYRISWKTSDGTIRSEIKRVSYTIAPRAGRTIAVDRQYFDTAEGEHTTDIVRVTVEAITCRSGAPARAS